MRISDWSSDVCSSDLLGAGAEQRVEPARRLDLGGQHIGIIGADSRRQIARALGVGQFGQGRAAFGQERIVEYQRQQVGIGEIRSEEHTSELQSLMRISYAVFCLTKKKVNSKKTSTRK